MGPFAAGLLNKEILGPNFQKRKPKIIAKLKAIIIIFFTVKLYLNLVECQRDKTKKEYFKKA